MRSLFKVLVIIPFTFLVACSNNKNDDPISVEEFQKVTDSLKDHSYKTCLVTRTVTKTSVYNSEDYSGTEARDNYANYHYENDGWVIGDADMNLIDAYKPQTLHGADIDGMLDKRYQYTFLNNPIRVHMHRTFLENETTGYITYDWKYDSYGYLIHIYSYRYEKYISEENDYIISEAEFNFVYK